MINQYPFAVLASLMPAFKLVRFSGLLIAAFFTLAPSTFAETYTIAYSSSQKWVNLSNLVPGTHTFEVTGVPGELDTKWRKSQAGGYFETDWWYWGYTASFTVTITTSDREVVADFHQDSGNNEYSHNHGWNLSFDTSGPYAPGSLSMNSGDDTGYSNSDKITSDRRPQFTWNTPSDRGGNSIAQYQFVVQRSSGSSVTSGFPTSRSFTPSSNLSDGSYRVRVQAKDSAGNWGDWSSYVYFTVDTSAPGRPSPYLDSSSDTGYSSSDRITRDSTPRIRWSSVSGAYRYHYDVGDSSPDRGNTTSTSWTASSQSNGSKTFYIQAEDAAGNKGSVGSVSVTIDTSAPSAPSLSLSSGSDTGESATDRITKDNTPTITWSSVSGAHRYICDVNDSTPDASYVSGTSWTTGSLSNGAKTIYVRSEDVAGNQSSSSSLSLTIDTSAPPAPSWVNMRSSSDSGKSSSDAITNIRRPYFDWASVSDSSGITKYHVLVQTSSGTEVYQRNRTGTSELPETNLSDGNYKFLVQAEDKAGNWGSWSSPRNFTIDTSAPLPPTFSSPAEGAFLSDTTPTLSWQGVSGGWKYQVLVSEDAVSGPLQSYFSSETTSTTWTVSPALGLKPWKWQVRAWDVAGNVGQYGRNGVIGGWGHFAIDMADMAIEEITVSPGPDYFLGETEISIRVRISNRGSTSTELNKSFLLECYLQGEKIFSRGYTNFAPGDEVNQLVFEGTITTPMEEPTDLIISASLDPGSSVADKDRSNNSKNQIIHILIPDNEPPPLPTLLSPSNGVSLTDKTPLFDWTNVVDPQANGEKYDIQVALDSGFTELIINESELLGSQFATAADLEPGTYYWRVRSKDYASNISAWSDSWSFTIESAPNVEMTVYRISDTNGNENTQNPGVEKLIFSPGETVRITFSANNTGDPVNGTVVLNIIDSANGSDVYDSASLGTNNSTDTPIDTDETDYFSYDFVLPSNLNSGYYHINGSIRSLDNFDEVIETTAFGPNSDWTDSVIENVFQVDVDVPMQFESGCTVVRDRVLFFGVEYNWHAAVYWFYDGYAKTHRLFQANGLGIPASSVTWDGFLGDDGGKLRRVFYISNASFSQSEKDQIIYASLWNLNSNYNAARSGYFSAFSWQGLDSQGNLSEELKGFLRCDTFVQAAYNNTLSFVYDYLGGPKQMAGAHNAIPVPIYRPKVDVSQLSFDDVTGAFTLNFTELMSRGTLDPTATSSISLTGDSGRSIDFDVEWIYQDRFGSNNNLYVFDKDAGERSGHPTHPSDPLGNPEKWIRHDVIGIIITPLEGMPQENEVLRLVLNTQATDLGGNSLLGDNDGVPGESFVVEGTMAEVNESPTDILLSKHTVLENQPSGTVIGSLSTVDPDSSDTFTYTLVSGTGSADNDSFSIQGNSLRTATSFDFESQNSYSILVRTTDQGGLSYDEAFTITVLNVNEAPVLSPIGNQTVDELAALTFTAFGTDPDLPAQTLIYSVIGAPDGASINSSTGAFSWTPNEVQGPGSYPFRVQVSDGELSDSEEITVTVNEVNEGGYAETWLEDNLPPETPAELRTLNADADFDGVSNLMEYAMVMNPGVPDSRSLMDWGPEPATKVMELEVQCRADDPALTFVCAVSQNMNSWTEVTFSFDSDTNAWSTNSSEVEISSQIDLGNAVWKLTLRDASGFEPVFVRMGIVYEP